LARSFRYYGKKRGSRRTGSPQWASAGEAALWTVFLVLGCVGTVAILANFVVPEWRVNHEFVQTTCKVLDRRLDEKHGDEGPLYRPEIKIEYEVGGEIHRHWHYDIHRTYSNNLSEAQAICDSFDLYDAAKDNRYPCWYDPADPYVAVLVRGYGWWIWLVLTVPVSFVAIGAGGLIYAMLRWGKSAERRAALMRRAADRDFFGAAGHASKSYPGVPQGADMTNSPGTRLRFRLPMDGSPGWALFGALAFCIVWNGIVAALVVGAVKNHLQARPDWFLTFFIIPFVLIGLAAIVFFIRQLLIAARVGLTLLEISDHPLRPGEAYRLFFSQSGRLQFNTLRVCLTCEESASYAQGTNTRTETQEVFRREIFRRDGLQIESGLPFEAEIDLEVPEEAMHSFKSDHNEIQWRLPVEGDLPRWPDFKRSFPVIIRPAPRGVFAR